ncbi:GPI mannosyltransferase 2 [Drosophila miranda]|uniref:GPI mannosyltransferase 2 n=1 Tax=Drosophila miranda TaxID=7229 RepID=UPI0007E6253D|nr:GPI mannosyltransferase 2 [Drosophila miranda]XP_033246295.1 GPI mannosyltransferase 2 [Drosophila miranda]
MTGKVTKLALTSRVIVLVVQLLANFATPDHKPDVFRMPQSEGPKKNGPFPWLDELVLQSLSGLRHWDGEYFLHIASNLYTYENTLAFYPLYPVVVRHVAQACQHLGIPLSRDALILLVAVALNVFIFCKTANVLYKLTQRMFNDHNKSWNAALIFCFNPASIFFSAAYSETFFAFASFSLMLECMRSEKDFRTLRLGAALTGCFVCRSNGLLTLGFPLYFLARHILLSTSSVQRCSQLFKMGLAMLVALGILHTYYFYIYRLYCLPDVKVQHAQHVVDYAKERSYLISGQASVGSPWCGYTLPFPYTYVQSHYWDVGFLRYYKWKQLPNFLLALPMLLFMHWHCYDYIRKFVANTWSKISPSEYQGILKEHISFPFVLHAAVLTLVCTLYVHIQVSTRLLASATPVFYWFAADYMPNTFQLSFRSKAGALFIWCLTYSLVGTVLFSNNYPWT